MFELCACEGAQCQRLRVWPAGVSGSGQLLSSRWHRHLRTQRIKRVIPKLLSAFRLKRFTIQVRPNPLLIFNIIGACLMGLHCPQAAMDLSRLMQRAEVELPKPVTPGYSRAGWPLQHVRESPSFSPPSHSSRRPRRPRQEMCQSMKDVVQKILGLENKSGEKSTWYDSSKIRSPTCTLSPPEARTTQADTGRPRKRRHHETGTAGRVHNAAQAMSARSPCNGDFLLRVRYA